MTEQLDNDDPPIASPELTTILAGLIRTMWTVLSQAWLDHLRTIHQANESTQSPVTLNDLRNQVRTIHLLKEKTLPIFHHYFHRDLEGYLAKANIKSLQMYIDHYLPAIELSIQRSDDLYTTCATTPHNLASPVPLPAAGASAATLATIPTAIVPPPSHQSQLQPQELHKSTEEPSHRKRNCRRILTRIVRTIRKWSRSKFHNSQPP
jgi:hypothetical protein